MRSFLAKRWFLLLLSLGIALALLATEQVRVVVQPIPPRAVVALTLFLMAWSLESRRLWSSLVQPGPALWATVISYGLLPGLGWLVSLWFSLPDYRIGFLIVTSVPCTLASAAIWTRLAGGNEATALLVTMLTTCTSWLITTAWLSWTTGANVAVDTSRMMLTLLVWLIIPVAIGQLARWPESLRQIAMRGKIAFGVISRLLIFIIVLQAVVKAAGSLGDPGAGAQAAALIGVSVTCLALHLTALAFGFLSSKAMRFDRPSQIAVALAGSQKTLPIGIMLADAYYRECALAVVPILFYHVGQLLADTLIADWLARKPSFEKTADFHSPTNDF